MTKEEYLAKLNEAFHDFRFFPDDHHYEYKGQRVGISVTRLIEEYINEFDSQAVAEKVIKKNQRIINDIFNNPLSTIEDIDYAGSLKTSVQEVLDEWKYKNELSCRKGSQCHEFVQSLWSGEEYMWNGYQNDLCSYDEFWNICDYIFEQAQQFHEDYKDKLEHLADEFVIGSEEYDIASAIDHLFINTLTGGLVLVDYKTNSDIHKNEKYAGKMKAPLSSLKDTTLNHYYIQLSIYKYLVEKYAGIKVDEMFIVYMSENIENYEIIDVPYLKKEVETILEWRKYE